MQERDREFGYTRGDFNFLRSVANQRTGIVVSDDKFDMFYSRLSKRIRKLGLKDFKAYCDLIRSDSGEGETLELVNAITTNLTAFFREKHHFDYLTKTVLPELQRTNASKRQIRIWSAGCSTGEEPYSLAMTLREYEGGIANWDTRVLATDIDSNVLQTAARGVYPLERVKDLQKARLRRWFLKGSGANEGKVRVKPEVSRLIAFGQLNLMTDWAMDELQDVIFCRNVIIYFDKPTKQRLISRFADNLKPGGHLIIGHSESLHNISDRFESIGNTIYRKKGV